MSLPFLSLKRRISPILLFLFLLSCTKSRFDGWNAQNTVTPCPNYNSHRIWAPKTTWNGIEVEIVASSCGTRMYFNVFACPIEPAEDGSCTVPVTLEIDEQKSDWWVYRLEGGQRFLVPDDLAAQIMEALLYEQCVTVYLGMYHSTVPYGNFPVLYEQTDLFE